MTVYIYQVAFCFEYAIYPTFLFMLIYSVARKEKQSSEYDGLSRIVEILSKNWWELSLTFLCTWALFEYRLTTEGVSLAMNRMENPVISVAPRLVSYLSFAVLVIVYLIYYTYIRYDEKTALLHQYMGMIQSVKLSVIPFTLYCNLWIITLFYDNVYIRIVALVISFSFGLWYVRRICWTYVYWFVLAGTMKVADPDDQIKALEYLLKSYYQLSFSIKESAYKYSRVLATASKCYTIYKDLGVRTDGNAQFAKLVEKIKYELRYSNKKALDTGNDQSRLLNKWLEKLKEIK